jgi:hypothetical protein
MISLIFMSDGTHLSNFAADTKHSAVYMAIGNLSSKLCQMLSTHRVVIVTLLQISIKNFNIPQKRLDEEQVTKGEVLNKVLWRVIQPLTFEQNPNAESEYFNVLCTDGNFRHCYPVLAASFADYPEYSDLHQQNLF